MESTTFPLLRFGTWAHCAYCGEPSTCREHVIPVAFMSKTGNRELAFQSGPIALACSECNHRLGVRLFKSFEERVAFIADKYMKLSKPCAAKWQAADYEEMSRKLVRHIKSIQKLRQDYAARSQWQGSQGYLENLESLIYENLLTETSNEYNERYHRFFAETLARVKFWRDTKKSCGFDSREACAWTLQAAVG